MRALKSHAETLELKYRRDDEGKWALEEAKQAREMAKGYEAPLLEERRRDEIKGLRARLRTLQRPRGKRGS